MLVPWRVPIYSDRYNSIYSDCLLADQLVWNEHRLRFQILGCVVIILLVICWHISSNSMRTLHPRKLTAGGPQKMIFAERKRWLPSNIWPFWVPGTPKQPFINGCFNWMISNPYIEHGCFTISIHLYMVGLGVPGIYVYIYKYNFWGSLFQATTWQKNWSSKLIELRSNQPSILGCPWKLVTS